MKKLHPVFCYFYTIYIINMLACIKCSFDSFDQILIFWNCFHPSVEFVLLF